MVAGILVAIAVLFGVVAFLKRAAPDAPETAVSGTATPEERDRLLRFWEIYRQATEHRIAGRTRDAAAAYEQALALNPGHQDALYYLGSMQFDLGDLTAAEASWRRLVAVDPSNARGHSQLGLLYSCVDNPVFLQLDRAAAEFERALAINREETGSLLHLGEVALLQGDLERARGYFDAVVGSNYTSVPAYTYKAYVAWKQGAVKEAEALFGVARQHAQHDAPPAGVAGEGDTRTGRTPMVRAATACRPMRVRTADLTRTPEAGAVSADSVFRAIDAILRDARSAPR